MQRLLGAAEECCGEPVQRLAYRDNEQGWCTITEASLEDALSFAEPSVSGGEVFSELAPRADVVELQLVVLVIAEPGGGLAAGEASETPPPPPPPSGASSEPPPLGIRPALDALRELCSGMDPRSLLPKFAAGALRIVQDVELPELDPLIETLDAFAEGRLGVNDVPGKLQDTLEVLRMIPPEEVQGLLERMKFETDIACQEARREQEQLKQPGVEVHVDVRCDGCNACPIVGPRHTCQECPDFDLCERCFQRSDRGTAVHRHTSWRQVRTDCIGDVVDSFYGQTAPCGQHRGVACDGCEMTPILGIRFRCEQCPDYDLCGTCHARCGDLHNPSHTFQALQVVDAASVAIPAEPEERTPLSEEALRPPGVGRRALAEVVEALDEEACQAVLYSLAGHANPRVQEAVEAAIHSCFATGQASPPGLSVEELAVAASPPLDEEEASMPALSDESTFNLFTLLRGE